MEYIATLNCRSRFDGKRHKVAFNVSPPTLGEEIYCFRCNQMARIIYTPYEYVAICQDCKYASRHPTHLRALVDNYAAGHATHREGHTVDIYRGAGAGGRSRVRSIQREPENFATNLAVALDTATA